MLNSAKGQAQNGCFLNPLCQHLKSMSGFLRASEQSPKQRQTQCSNG